MTGTSKRLGALALASILLALTAGCSSNDELIPSGNIVATLPANTVEPTATDYQCIRMGYTQIQIRPTDGICSADSDRPGDACGADRDCTNVAATCRSFATVCVGGANDGNPCNISDPNSCGTDGVCSEQGECVSVDHVFTGVSCFSTVDCDVAAGERCGGACGPNSPIAGQPCFVNGDCTLGDCVGGQVDDTIESSNIILVSAAENAFAYFTPECPTCEFDRNPVRFCQSNSDCQNRCLPGSQLQTFCPVGLSCCEKLDDPDAVVTPVCETNADCPTNQCVDSSVSLPSSTLPEGKYRVTRMAVGNLLLYSPGGVRVITSCSFGTDVSTQYADDPLEFTVGSGQPNTIRSVINLTELENLLGSNPAPQCLNAEDNFDEWFRITSD